MSRGRGVLGGLATLTLPVTVLLVLALVGSGTGVLLLGRSLPGPRAVVDGGNRPVDAGATDPRDLDANNSPSLARSPVAPDRLAVVNRVDRPFFSCALHLTDNGGRTWRPRDLPFPDGEEAPPRCYAPDVAFDAAGTLFVSFVTLAGAGNVPHAVWTTASADGGRTFSAPRQALGPLVFQTRLVADRAVAGRLDLTYLQAASVGTLLFPDTGNPIMTVASDDGGTTWAEPVRVSPEARARVVAPTPAAGRGDERYVAYLDVRDDRLDYHGAHAGQGGEPFTGTWSLLLARSPDGGRTWAETVVDDAVVPTSRFVAFVPPAPAVAVDPNGGRVYVAFHDGRMGDADVWLWVSVDGERSFARPRRVNDNLAADGTSQYLPQVSLAPGGRLDVLYYDRRSDDDDRRNAAAFQYSDDHGSSFRPAVRASDRSFDSRIGFGSERGLPDLGSRLALASGRAGALAVWTDTRAGTPASGKQDLAAAVITVSGGSPARGPLRVAGVALLAAGCLLTAARGGAGAGLLLRQQHRRRRQAGPDETAR